MIKSALVVTANHDPNSRLPPLVEPVYCSQNIGSPVSGCISCKGKIETDLSLKFEFNFKFKITPDSYPDAVLRTS